MKIFSPNQCHLSGGKPLRRAFSLVEMLVAVGIMGLMVTGLLAIFSMTSKALRRSNVQTDVLETGRMVMELLTREVQQMHACNLSSQTNFNSTYFSRGLVQTMAGGGKWTNHLYDLYLLNGYSTNWQGIGYCLDPVERGYGTLYRFETNASLDGVHNFYPTYKWMLDNFNNDPKFNPTNFPRVADGIVHFSVKAYDADGYLSTWLIDGNHYVTNGISIFKNTELPAFVEIELAIIESQVLEQIKAMPVNVATNFLMGSRGAASTHLFRQLIPIRTIEK